MISNMQRALAYVIAAGTLLSGCAEATSAPSPSAPPGYTDSGSGFFYRFPTTNDADTRVCSRGSNCIHVIVQPYEYCPSDVHYSIAFRDSPGSIGMVDRGAATSPAVGSDIVIEANPRGVYGDTFYYEVESLDCY